jgi:hypothetical protein
MDFVGIDKDRACLRFTVAELVIVANALNEICNGVRLSDADFAARVGSDRTTAQKLLREFSSATDVSVERLGPA